MAAFSENFHNENDFEDDLSTFYCYDYEKNGYSANGSEAVENIATDQKDYHKCSLCVIVCYIAAYRQYHLKKIGY